MYIYWKRVKSNTETRDVCEREAPDLSKEMNRERRWQSVVCLS